MTPTIPVMWRSNTCRILAATLYAWRVIPSFVDFIALKRQRCDRVLAFGRTSRQRCASRNVQLSLNHSQFFLCRCPPVAFFSSWHIRQPPDRRVKSFEDRRGVRFCTETEALLPVSLHGMSGQTSPKPQLGHCCLVSGLLPLSSDCTFPLPVTCWETKRQTAFAIPHDTVRSSSDRIRSNSLATPCSTRPDKITFSAMILGF